MLTNKILYGIIYCWTKIHAMLPMRVLYVLSDILYVVVYHIVHYRRNVVKTNLKNSFPEKSEKERKEIEKKFYHHFADYVVETIKLAHISAEEIHQRAFLNNPEVILDLIDKGHNCIIMLMGHYGNWEWFTASKPFFNNRAEIYNLYRPLDNKSVDKLFFKLRTRFTAKCIKKNDAARDIITIKRSGQPSLMVFVADQTPSKANLHYWTTFLNQDSAILTGPERIAAKLDIPVVYNDIKQIRRGYYTVDFKILSEYPKEEKKFSITEKYARLMEETILRAPEYWLWTHKRWKHKR